MADLHGLDEADWARVRRLAAESVHPVSRALAGRCGVRRGAPTGRAAQDVQETVGEGISGVVDGVRVAIGSAAFVSRITATA